MKSFSLSNPTAFVLGCCALLTLSIPGCDQAESETMADEVEEGQVKKAKKPKTSKARKLVEELRADCESTMERCAAVTCSTDSDDCASVMQVCDTQLAGMCELVEADAQADEIAPCTEGTRCELMEAIHACFKDAGGCDGQQAAKPGDDCLLQSLSKLPACVGQAMKDHGGDCGGGGCPGSGSDCEECDKAQGPGDGCLLDPGTQGGSCPAGGCLLNWVKTITGGKGGCLLKWLGKNGEGCPGCDGQ